MPSLPWEIPGKKKKGEEQRHSLLLQRAWETQFGHFCCWWGFGWVGEHLLLLPIGFSYSTAAPHILAHLPMQPGLSPMELRWFCCSSHPSNTKNLPTPSVSSYQSGSHWPKTCSTGQPSLFGQQRIQMCQYYYACPYYQSVHPCQFEHVLDLLD